MEVRNELKQIFGIPRSRGSQVDNNKVVSDGHTHEDLANITVEKMQAYTGSADAEFFHLFELVLIKLSESQEEVAKAKREAQEVINAEADQERRAKAAEALETVAAMANEVLAKPKRGHATK